MFFAKLLDLIHNNREFSIILMVVFVLLMFIIPIPTIVMDTVIAFNLGITVLVLMVVLYINTPLQLSSFPSILLILALFRIGITVSTSRLILLDGDGGEIIQTFGMFVVGGNMVVGIIIFSIVTLINFLVITKGSERVAEVAARFSLDAMPGKQMSIDSDLRAGNITMEEAVAKRNEVGLESKLFGAMDGAMKFVKGDSIASIVDIIINLVGGLIIGIVQKDMAFSQALTTYSILTIGDGLVQQIPTLLISLTAGIMITRVNDSNDKQKQNMGQTLINQLFRHKKSLYSAGSALLIFALIPGMPYIVLITMSLGMFLIAYLIKGGGGNSSLMDDSVPAAAPIIEQNDSNTIDNQIPWKINPLAIVFSDKLKNTLEFKKLKEIITSINSAILFDTGVQIPQISFSYSSNLPDNSYQVLITEIPVSTCKIFPNLVLAVSSTRDNLVGIDTASIIENNTNIGLQHKSYWISNADSFICETRGIKLLKYDEFIKQHINFILYRHLADFIGLQETKNILDKLPEYVDLTRELLRMIPLNKITEILQRLVSEGISIRNFKAILDAMLEWSQREKEVIIITEHIRKALGRYIAYKFSSGTYILPCVLLDEELEETIRAGIRFTSNGSYLSLDDEFKYMIIKKVEQILLNNTDLSQPLVLVTQMDIRRYLRSIIETELPTLPVLSFQEVEGLIEFQTIEILNLENYNAEID